MSYRSRKSNFQSKANLKTNHIFIEKVLLFWRRILSRNTARRSSILHDPKTRLQNYRKMSKWHGTFFTILDITLEPSLIRHTFQIYSTKKERCCYFEELTIQTKIISDDTEGNVPCPNCYSNGFFPGTKNNTYYHCEYDTNENSFLQSIYVCPQDTIYDSHNFNCSAATRPSVSTVSDTTTYKAKNCLFT